jgi:cyclopropane fatty-acyl-phospholipid synthase-like methyltransferase
VAEDDFTWFREHHADNMERMFAAVGDLYAEHWGEFFHFAIFEDDSEGRDIAFERTHRRYAEALRVHRAARVLELACGRGGFAEFLATHTEGEVLGIDISRAQLSHAARRHRQPNLRFRRHDVMEVERLGERFDAIAFLDAECYLPDKRAAVAAIARAMNPSARLLLVAWCKRDGLGRHQEELVLHPFMRYWGIPGLETPSAYRDHFRCAGLRLLEEIDLNEKVRRNWELGYQRAIEGVRDLTLARVARLLWKGLPLGAAGVQLVKEQFPAALYIKAGFDSGFLCYTYFLAEKD